LERLLVAAVVAVEVACLMEAALAGIARVLAGGAEAAAADSQATQTRLAGLEEITTIKTGALLLPERAAQFHLLVLTV
jgi:hypothetical protein